MSKKSSQNGIKFEIAGVCLILASIYIYISLFSKNSGIVGEQIKTLTLGIFGLGAYIVPVLIIVLGLAMVYRKDAMQVNIKFYSFCIFLVATLIALFLANYKEIEGADSQWLDAVRYYYALGALNAGGGALGGFFGYAFVMLFGIVGTITIVAALYIISILMFTEISFASILDHIRSLISGIYARLKDRSKETAITRELQKKTAASTREELELMASDEERIRNMDKKIKILDFTKRFDKDFKGKDEGEPDEKPRENPKEASREGSEAKEHKAKLLKEQQDAKAGAEAKIVPINNKHYANYKLPSPSLLSLPAENKSGSGKKEVMSNVKILDDTLKNFGVSANIAQVSVGPTITRYELQLSPGVKVSKILSLADDISLSLASPGIRIEAPIPGKAAIGIEVPNKDISSVLLREVLESEEFKSQKSRLTFTVGKDVAGANIVADLAKMPHLLIAGSTGSGKSVCINTLIASILYKATPDEVKLLLIDPKVVELSIYKNIPHLLVPVVTDPKKAAGALNWAVMEMTERYKKFAANNVRDIYGYNAINKEGIEKLPQIVVIIDELADLMMVAPGEVEDAICRLAQMARAAGIHLVVATQRPSVDVITGLIKANIPSRISFAVSSQVDSRTILDMGGAEKLLGKGDSLFYPVGAAKPIRVQGAFVSEKEIERLVAYIKDQVPASFNDELIKEIEQSVQINEDEEVDSLLKDAIEIVVESGQASILMLQRRLKIGYSRAARLIDQMEERRIIGGYEGSKPRKVLVSKEDLDESI
ncbi:MAG TPA: DNA translocase FtsK 4TM domain-containing protein [Clostridia bacterium]|nr:DNA translocase FtsK 4TM domain-containing protein [Clostridia bacterium]